MRVTRERRRHVVGLVRRVRLHELDLDDEARAFYIASALVADDAGTVSEERAIRAWRDGTTRAMAWSILALTKPGALT